MNSERTRQQTCNNLTSPSRIHSNNHIQAKPSPSPHSLNNPGNFTAAPARLDAPSPLLPPYPHAQEPAASDTSTSFLWSQVQLTHCALHQQVRIGCPRRLLNAQPTGPYPVASTTEEGTQRPTTTTPPPAQTRSNRSGFRFLDVNNVLASKP